MDDSRTFTVAGISTFKGRTKYRAVNVSVKIRTASLEKSGHTNIKLFDLPSAMTKAAAIAWLNSEHGISIQDGGDNDDHASPETPDNLENITGGRESGEVIQFASRKRYRDAQRNTPELSSATVIERIMAEREAAKMFKAAIRDKLFADAAEADAADIRKELLYR